MAKCYYCKGTTEIRKVDVDFRWGDKLFVVKKVPVEICTKCGERYYSPEVSRKIDQVVKESKEGKRPKQTLQVPVFDLPA